MKCKKIMLISLFLLLILMLGAVSAASDSDDIVSYDLSDDQIIQSNELNDVINEQSSADDPISSSTSDANADVGSKINEEIIDDEILSSEDSQSTNDEILSENSDATLSNSGDQEVLGATKSYNDLYYLIYPSSGATPSTITLNDDYVFNGDTMTWHGGINIKRSITIYGNGHTINGNGRIGHFTITESATLTIYDLNLINGLEVTDDQMPNRGGSIVVPSRNNLNAYNCNFTNCKSALGGAIYSYASSSVTLNNCVFTGNQATYTGDYAEGGGAIAGAADRYTITNCVFKNNYAPIQGGAIDVQGTTLTIKGTTFSGNSINSEDNAGAAIAMTYVNTVIIENSKFDGNKVVQSTGGGGAFYATSVNTLNVTSSNFTNNVGYGGGAIAAYNVSSFNVRDSAFRNNNGTDEGAAIWMFNATASISNTDFIANILSSGRGGAIYSGGDRTLTVSNSRFTNNKANNGNGGAIYKSSSSLTVTGSSFTGNNASKGGAIYIYGVSSATVTNSNITDGVASDSGGAIFSDSSTLTVRDSKLNNNNAANRAGAIYSTKNIEITGSSFSGNSAGLQGGAIYQLGGTTMTITGSSFTNNAVPSDKQGGAVYVSSTSNVNIKNSNFTSNSAKAGGAYYVIGEVTSTVNGSTFTNNNAEMGGAIYYDGKTLTVNASTLTNNKASNSGGAFYIETSTLNIGNSTISNNNASAAGGAIIAMRSAKITLFNATLSENKAYNGSAVYLYENSTTLTVSKSTFNNNAATNTGTIYAVPTSTISISDSRFNSNSAGTLGGAIHASSSTITVSGSNFTNNNAAGGGAISVENSSTVNINGSSFSGNSAQQHGGAIYASSSTLTVRGSSFSGNSAQQNGGAILASSTPLTIVGSTFNNNTAVSNGGVIYTASNLNIANSTMAGNKAVNGSAIYTGSTFTIANSTIANNTASTYGAMFTHNYVTGSVSNSNFTSNHAKGGSALFTLQLNNITFNNSTFSENQASQQGGGIFIYPNSNVTFINSTFRNNYAPGGGAAIYAYDGSILTVKGSIFYNNTAQQNGGVYANAGELNNCTFANTTIVGSISQINCKILQTSVFSIGNIADTVYNGAVTVSVTESNKFNGTVTVTIGTKSVSVTLQNGVGSANVNLNIAPGVYRAVLNFPGTEIFSPSYAESNQFSVRYQTSLTIANIPNTIQGNSFVLNVSESNGYTGDVTVKIGSKSYTVHLNNGRGTTNVNDLGVGTYKATIDFQQTDAYTSAHAESNQFTILYRTAFTIASIPNATVGNPITISVSEANGYTGDVTVKVGTNSYTVSLSNGQGSKSVSDLPVGTYKATISFTGTNTYSSASAESNQFTIKPVSFIDLANIINNAASGSTITLDKDYEFISDYDSSLVNGIIINKNIVINGNGHTIDMNSLARMFNITNGVTVKIQNLNFADGSSSLGGAIYINGSTLNIEGSNFDNNHANMGGAIDAYDSIITVKGSTFRNNAASMGGTICIKDSDLKVIDSIFIGNSAGHGGAIYISENSNLNIVNSNFTNHSTSYDGGAVYADDSSNVNITKSTFVNNTASQSKVAIRAVEGKITNCTFNESTISGGISVSDDCKIYYTPKFSFSSPIINCFNGSPIDVYLSETHRFSGTVTLTVGNTSFNVVLVNGSGHAAPILDVPLGTYKAILNFTGNEFIGPFYLESNPFTIRCLSFYDLNEMISNAESGSIITLENDYNFYDVFDSEFVNGIPINKNIVIDGNGHTIDAKGLARIFNITNGAMVTITNINLINGNASDGGAIYASSGTELDVLNSVFDNNVAIGTGGAIYSVGILRVDGATFVNNVAESGSGVYANTGLITGSTFVNGNDASGSISVSDDCKFLTSPLFEIGAIPDIIFGSSITISISESHGLNGTVTVTIGTEAYDIELANGVGSKTVTPNLVPGTYKAILSFNETVDFYSASAESNEFAININPTAISASAVTATYSVSKNLVATLKDSNGKALSGVKVTIKLSNGKTYTKETDKNGQVKLSVSGLVPKAYTATITFAGDDKYAKSTKSVKVTVKKATPKMTAKAKTFKVKVKTKKYTITLKNNKGKVMKNTKVTLKVNKKTFTAKTNSKGIATFKITNLKKKGTFKSVIKYAGSKYYNKVTKNVKITVKA